MKRNFTPVLVLASASGVTLWLLLLGNALLSVWYANRTVEPDSRIRLPVYDGYRWAEQYGIDQATHYRNSEKKELPYTLWKRGPFKSAYVNIDSMSLRHTPKAPLPKARKVFVFGGSTVWGTGSPDSLTLPALLQKLLGSEYDVYNYGEAAYVHAQCQQLLLVELSAGRIPDAVIFLDGANDTYTGVYSPGVPRHPHLHGNGLTRTVGQIPGLSNYAALAEWAGDVAKNGMRETAAFDAKCRPHIAERAEQTVRTYLRMVRQTTAIAEAYGFSAHFYWQPSLLSGSRNLLPYETELSQNYSTVMAEVFSRSDSVANRLISNSAMPNVHFLGRAFDTVAQPVYIDWCHVGPIGNAILASEIAQSAFFRDTVFLTEEL